MRNASPNLDSFTSSSAYSNPVDVKKLKFIFSTIEKYASSKHIKMEDLRVLEVACGAGGITFPLASLGCQVRAFDIDETAVRDVQNRIDRDGVRNLAVTVDNAYTFEDGKVYDVVVASEILEHALDPARLAVNVRRRMRDGSWLIVTVPNGYGPWELSNRVSPRSLLREWEWLRRRLGKPPFKARYSGHVQFFTRKRIVNIFAELSMRLVESGKSDSLLAAFGPFRRSVFFGDIDTRLADILPRWLASGWYFVFELDENSTRNLGS
jgi:SAM-dependent methyltransferase